jgi:DNA modification methylase
MDEIKIRKPRSDKGKKRGKYKKKEDTLLIKQFNIKSNNGKYTCYNNDCREVLKSFNNNSIHSIVTDPPYGISFMNHKWDYEIPPVKIFKEMLRTLVPGGVLLCFSSPRTYHRMAVNVEDAGFEIKDCLMWLYGGGFPKSQSIKDLLVKYFKNTKIDNDEFNNILNVFEKYRTCALKPAYEPVIMAMKPLDDNYANNAVKYLCSGLNIEECRLEHKGKKWEQPRGGIWKTDKDAKAILVDNDVGRFPANIIYEESDEVVEALIKSIDKSMNLKDKEFITRIFYCAKVKGSSKEGNDHPTIKPLSLMEYLCRLVKPPVPEGIILDPYMGSGTTGVACINEGIKFIGVEKEQGYFETSCKRMDEAIETKRSIFNEFSR